MVTWTARARADLKSIHAYIAKDAPLNARKVIQDIKQKADTLHPLNSCSELFKAGDSAASFSRMVYY